MDGVKWWRILLLEGYSRTILAGALAPTEATWAALMVLYTACLRYGVPDTLISDSGGAYTSNEFEAVCTRLQLQHKPIESSKGESYKNLVETHFNIQRRLYDYQFSLTHTPAELERRHQAFIQTYVRCAPSFTLTGSGSVPWPAGLAHLAGRFLSQLDGCTSRLLHWCRLDPEILSQAISRLLR